MAEQGVMERAAKNEGLLRTGYDAFARGDLATVQGLFDPNAVWHAQRLGVLSGDHQGWPAIAQFFGQTMQLTGGTFRVVIEEVMTNANGAACVVRSSGERDGKRLDSRQVHLYRIRNDRVAECWQFAGIEADEFWS